MYLLYGAVVGGILGFVGPFAFVAYLSLWEPSYSEAGTAFAIMTPFTAMFGIIVGASMGRYRGIHGHWNIYHRNYFNLSSLQGTGVDFTAARSLSNERLSMFEGFYQDDAPINDKENFLLESIGDYRYALKRKGIVIGVFCLLTTFNLPILPIAACLVIHLAYEVLIMRRRLTKIAGEWQIDITHKKFDLPWSLAPDWRLARSG